jgi:hypothetical protein
VAIADMTGRRLFVYLRYYTPPQADDPVESPTANLSSRRITVAAGSVITAVLPISFACAKLIVYFMTNNDHDKSPWKLFFIVLLCMWIGALVVLAIAMLAAQFVYQVRNLRVLRSWGSFSPLSAVLMGVALLGLAVAQSTRVYSAADWRQFGFLCLIDPSTLYAGAGIGFIVLYVISKVVGDSGGEGGIRL